MVCMKTKGQELIEVMNISNMTEEEVHASLRHLMRDIKPVFDTEVLPRMKHGGELMKFLTLFSIWIALSVVNRKGNCHKKDTAAEVEKLTQVIISIFYRMFGALNDAFEEEDCE